MGRRNRKFDKSRAVTFQVVHRSQNDPLANDESAPQFVLQPKINPFKASVQQAAILKTVPNECLEVLDDDVDVDEHADNFVEDGDADDGDSDLESKTHSTASARRSTASARRKPRPDMDDEDEVVDAAGAPAFMDDYDYEQHMRPTGAAGAVFVAAKNYNQALAARYQSEAKVQESVVFGGIKLPSDVFGASTLNQLRQTITPNRQLIKARVTKDYFEALEADEDAGFEEIEDDFVMKADAGYTAEARAPTQQSVQKSAVVTTLKPAPKGIEMDEEEHEEGDEEGEDEDEDEDQYDEGDEEGDDEEGDEDEDNEDEVGDDQKGDHEDDEADTDDLERRFAHVMPSTVESYGPSGKKKGLLKGPILDPRLLEDAEDEEERERRKLRLLDDHFAHMMAEYEDEEIGELDEQDPALMGDVETIEPELLNDFRNAPSKTYQPNTDLDEEKRSDLKKTVLQAIPSMVEREDTEDTDKILDDMYQPPVREQWDVESILTTHTNTENHPRLIREPRRSDGQKIIKLSKKTGIPIGVLPVRGRNADEDHDMEDVEEEDEEAEAGVNEGEARPKDESKEDKKARKQAAKAAKRGKREQKKALRDLYRTETANQEKIAVRQAAAGAGLMKLS